MAGTASTNLGAFSPSLTKDIENAPSGVVNTIVGVAASIAKSRNFTPAQTQNLERVSVATAADETGGTFSPTAVGDNGTSFGEFQLHQGGELGSLSQGQAFNVQTNASTAIPTIADRLSTAGTNPNLGQVAATAQRPQDQTGYASNINALLAGTSVPSLADNGINGSGPGFDPLIASNFSSNLFKPTPTTGSNAQGSSSSTDSSGGLLAKIGGFLIGALLIGVGVMILFHGNSSTPPATAIVKGGAKAAMAE